MGIKQKLVQGQPRFLKTHLQSDFPAHSHLPQASCHLDLSLSKPAWAPVSRLTYWASHVAHAPVHSTASCIHPGESGWQCELPATHPATGQKFSSISPCFLHIPFLLENQLFVSLFLSLWMKPIWKHKIAIQTPMLTIAVITQIGTWV